MFWALVQNSNIVLLIKDGYIKPPVAAEGGWDAAPVYQCHVNNSKKIETISTVSTPSIQTKEVEPGK